MTFAASTTVLWAPNRRLETTQNVTSRTVNLAHVTIDYSLGTLDQIIRPLTDEVAESAWEEASRSLPMALQYYDKVAETCLGDERMQEVGAKAFRRAGRVRMLLGRSRGRADYRTAIRVYEKISAKSPGLLWLQAGLIETLQEYASLLTKPADAAEAEALFRRALSLAEPWIDNKSIDPHCFNTHYIGPFSNLAWDLVRRPPARAGDAALAIRLARRAVDWEPEQSGYWNTLGVAHYRAGEWGATSQALQRAIELGQGGTAADWFLLACVNQ